MEDRTSYRPRQNVVPLDPSPGEREIVLSPLTQAQADYLSTRGISKATADALGIFGGMAWIRDKGTGAGSESPAIGFPYRNQGKPYAAKLRSITHKGFTQRGSAQTFWNIDRISDQDVLVITEGEIDCASLHEAGVPSPVSVPNGAPAPSGVQAHGKIDPREDGRFGYIFRAKDALDRAKRVVIAVDNDGPGDALAEELARRIGKHKCWRASFPAGCKDANDTLVRHGTKALSDCIANAAPWPVNGLYEADHFFPQLDILYAEGASRGASTGYPQLDEIYTIAPGQVTVVTGVPSSGKSEFVDQLMVNLADKLGWRLALCSFENEPKFHLVKLVQKYVGRPFFQGKSARMTEDELTVGKTWVKDHFTFLYQADGSMADIDSILERIRVAVMRSGIRGAVIDPYNFIERPHDINETEFVSTMLTKLKLFAAAHEIHIWIIAHPAKMYRTEGGKIPIPTGYDISGSGHWFNKADCGITVHRNLDEGVTEIHTWKVRFQWVGSRGMQAMAYDPVSTRYVIDDPFSKYADPIDRRHIPHQFDDMPPVLTDPAFAVTPRL